MNSRNTSTSLLRRTPWWGKSALLGAAIALGIASPAQLANSYGFTTGTGATLDPMTGSTTLLTQPGATDDNATAVQTIGFNFTYEGTVYTQYSVNVNGLMRLGATAVGTTFTNSTTGAANQPKIMPFHDDLHIGSAAGGGAVRTLLTGTSPNQIRIVEWFVRWPRTPTTNAANCRFQAWLYEGTNVVEFRYGTYTVDGTGTSASIGIGGLTATNFTSVTASAHTASSVTANDNNLVWPGSGRSYTFTPPVACSGTPEAGTVPTSVNQCNTATSGTAISATGFTTGQLGLTFQWIESDDNNATDPWAPAVGGSGATTTTYTTPVLAATRYYRMVITCTNSAQTDSTNSAQVNVVNCSYDVAHSTGATFTSIMPANGGSGLAFPGWQNTSGDDNTSTTVSLTGTTFQYQSTVVSGFQACSNGWMTFNTANTSTAFTNSIASATPNQVLAPFWDDLVFTGQAFANRDASCRYQVLGTLGSGTAVIVIEWAGIERFNIAGPNLNFQVRLNEAGNTIEYVYGTFEGFDGTVTSAYSYTIGYNGVTPAGTTAGDRFCMQTGVTNHWGTTASNSHVIMPACFTKFTLTPGTYTGPGAPPVIPAPSNDEAAGAQLLTVNTNPCSTPNLCNTYYSSRSATNSLFGVGSCATTAGNEDDDVWFTFTIANSNNHVVTLRSMPIYDGVLEVLDAGLTPIQCNDATGAGLIESITLIAPAPGTYYARVFHDAIGFTTTNGGQFSICVNEVQPPPANDDICGATSLTVGTSCTNTAGATTTATASAQANPSCTTAGFADDDVWYSFVAATTGDLVTVTSGTGFNAAMAVYSSSDNTCSGTLTQVVCVNATSTGGAETSTGPWVAGNTYFVRVYHAAVGFGGGSFNICVTASAPSCLTNPTSPANNGTVCDNTTPTLSWPAASGAASYDVYVDAVFQVNQTALTYVTAPLALGAHTWQIVPVNGIGAATGCPTWNFTISTTPTGVSASSNSPVCTGATLNLIGSHTGGSTFSWTGPNAFTGTNANESILSVTMAAAGTYTFTATNNGCSANANTVVVVNPTPVISSTTATPSTICVGGTSQLQVNLAALPPYCSATHTNGCGLGDEYISNVTFNTINNSSTCAQNGPSQYTDYTAINTAIGAGSATPISVGNPNFFTGDQCRVYVDWNQDGDFADSGEETILAGTTTFTGTVNAPASPINGNTRMRVRLTYTGTVTACGVQAYGETEDYTLAVTGGVDAYTYSWDNAGTLNNAAIANPISSAIATTLYTVTVSTAFCSAQGTVNLTVNPLPTVTCPNDTSVCGNSPAYALSGGSPTGGTYSGPGVSGGNFDPALAGTGPHTITYSYTDGNGCTNSCTFDITVVAPTLWYEDADNDTYGDPAVDSLACAQPAGYVADNTDDCPTVFGKNGDSCNDANPFTTGDILVACVCIGTPVPCDNWVLTINTDGSGSQTTWQMVDATSPFILDSGGPYPSNATINETICVPQGACFDLIFSDSGNNGINPGGWTLRDNNNKRVIDNSGNGSAFTTSAQNDQEFCNPVGNDALTIGSCDKLTWLSSQYIVASPNAAVSAQWGVGNQADDGYQMWFFNPVGGYNRRILHSHAVSMGYGPASATRACHIPLTFSPFPLPFNTLLNVRVRSLVNGVYSDFGPACKFMLLSAPPACPTTQLDNNPLNIGTTYSCGVTGKQVGASGAAGKLWALPVSGATHYRFRLEVPSEGYVRQISVTGYTLTLGAWSVSPLLCGTFTYDVTVAVSMNGGVTYCPFGPLCTVGITNGAPNPCTAPFQGGNQNLTLQDGAAFTMWPNPNRGDQLNLSLSEVEEGVSQVFVEVYDVFGKRVMVQAIATDAAFTTVMELNSELASGIYTVNLVAGSRTYTERLVIQ